MQFRSSLTRLALVVVCFAAVVESAPGAIDLGGKRELFVDDFLISSRTNVALALHEPRDEAVAFKFDEPWEGRFCAYVTVIHDGKHFRAYYRGKEDGTRDGVGESTCVAESSDGRNWTKPRLGLIEMNGTKENNVILAENGFSHNFSPFVDSNPACPADQRYKAVAGYQNTGLKSFCSPEGLQWRAMQNEPVLTTNDVPAYKNMFDSQNVAFWSATENRYVLFFRVFKERIRRVARAESKDFLHWTKIQLMEYRGADGSPAPVENLYTSQTHPYFRAPQIYVAVAARFMPGRQVLTDEEAKAIGVHPSYFHDVSDAVFMTSRGRDIYERVFMSAFIRPGIGAENWVSRTTYPALNVVQTGTNEMSIYANQNYAQPTAHLHRYSLRLDGFASLHAPYEGGEVVTKPLIFSGKQLLLNFSTSAAGGIKIGISNEDGKMIPGYGFGDSVESIGNEIERPARWKQGVDVSALAERPVRLHFKMKDADLYAIQFVEKR